MNVNAKLLGDMIQKRQEWLTTAESCTGGMIGAAITDIPGSSAHFSMGFITYSNAAKQQLLGVSAESLQAYGAVSEQVVREMVRGACQAAHAQWGMAVSGIAGPDGGSPDKPVGTVWLGWQAPEKGIWANCYQLTGDRASIREQAVNIALTELLIAGQSLSG